MPARTGTSAKSRLLAAVQGRRRRGAGSSRWWQSRPNNPARQARHGSGGLAGVGVVVHVGGHDQRVCGSRGPRGLQRLCPHRHAHTRHGMDHRIQPHMSNRPTPAPARLSATEWCDHGATGAGDRAQAAQRVGPSRADQRHHRAGRAGRAGRRRGQHSPRPGALNRIGPHFFRPVRVAARYEPPSRRGTPMSPRRDGTVRRDGRSCPPVARRSTPPCHPAPGVPGMWKVNTPSSKVL